MAVDPVRFRKIEDRVFLEGTAVVQSVMVQDELGITVFTLPEGFRPATETQCPVETERGPSVVTIAPNGGVLADPRDGWVRFGGISWIAA